MIGAPTSIAWAAIGLLWIGLVSCGPTQPDQEWPDPSPALWQVTSDDGDKAWLFGTVHALPDGAQWHTPLIDSSFAEADLLVVEIANLGDSGAAQSAFDELAYTPGLGAFQGRWGDEFDSKVEGILGSRTANLRPDIEDWAAALQIASAISTSDPANGVDRALLASDKPRIGLESYASQFAIFDGLSAQDQKQFLDAVVFEESAADPGAMDRAWLTGKLAELEILSETGILADAQVRDALLTRRNQRWVDQIAPLIDAGREPFVAVGAAHMLDAGGLPALLTQAGFTVERIQ